MTTIAQQRLDNYLAAEAKIVSSGQSLRVGDRQLQRAELAEIRRNITLLQMEVAREVASAAGRGGRFSQADFGGRT